MNFTKKDYTFDDLIDIMNVLRGNGGCPWDRAQTHQSIKYALLEEACEAMESLDKKTPDDFADELGDVLLQVVFHSAIAKDAGTFCMQDVLNHICNKLLSRHTHIFGDDKSENSEDALSIWEANKRKEKGQKTYTESMQDVCSYLPALLHSQKVQKKAAIVGFDWDCTEDAVKKLDEEILELKDAIKTEDTEKIEDEFGDLLFSCVNVSRFLKLNPEETLRKATDKFIARFSEVEKAAEKSGKSLDEMTLSEMDALWDAVKRNS